MLVVDRGGPIPNNVYDYTFDELYKLYREAIDPEMQDLVESTQRSRDYTIETIRKAKCKN